ncbi:MAG: hypothetical protein HON94_15325 [Methylococcales bacterium]|nr:hypothetical protein [Methylococcales bacterium]MBT7409151.1 hypothetical protein [Methylococcales bacterium]
MTNEAESQSQEPNQEANNDRLCLLDSRYCFRLNPKENNVPRLGVGASAIVLDGVDTKSNAEVAIKFVQMYKGTSPLSEVEARERFFDREVIKTKSLINESFLLEYLDDELLSSDDLILLSSSTGVTAYDVKNLSADIIGADVRSALDDLNSYIKTKPVDDIEDYDWNEELYEKRTQLRKLVRKSNKSDVRNVQILNGQRFLVTKKYQTTLSRLLVQQPNLPSDEKLELILELIKSIKQIHTVGITHGDLCPDNIMLKLSSHINKELASEVKEHGILPKYLYELQTVLIDLGRVVKGDMESRDQIPVGLPVREVNNRVTYAANEVAAMSERLPFERYRITYSQGDLVLEPIWEFDHLKDSDEWLGELTINPDGESDVINKGRRIGMMFRKGDVLYNSISGFVIKQVSDEKIILGTENIYQPDYEHFTLRKVPSEEYLEGCQEGHQWEYDDILYVSYQQGIPADFFALGIVIVETVVGKMIGPNALRVFSDHCKRIVVGSQTAAELTENKDLKPVLDAFKALDLADLFEIVLKCVIRGNKKLGYYCASHSDNSPIATIRLQSDFTRFFQKVIAVHSQTEVNNQLRNLGEQVDKYKNVLGPDLDRTAIFKEIGLTKVQLDELKLNNGQLKEENSTQSQNLASLQTSVDDNKKLNQELQEKLSQAESLAAALKLEVDSLTKLSGDQLSQIESQESKLSDLNGQITSSNQQADDLTSSKQELQDNLDDMTNKYQDSNAKEQDASAKITTMENEMKNFIEDYGNDFSKFVKGWGSKKPTVEMLKVFESALMGSESD